MNHKKKPQDRLTGFTSMYFIIDSITTSQAKALNFSILYLIYFTNSIYASRNNKTTIDKLAVMQKTSLCTKKNTHFFIFYFHQFNFIIYYLSNIKVDSALVNERFFISYPIRSVFILQI
jgi:hypothetical protein